MHENYMHNNKYRRLFFFPKLKPPRKGKGVGGVLCEGVGTHGKRVLTQQSALSSFCNFYG